MHLVEKFQAYKHIAGLEGFDGGSKDPGKLSTVSVRWKDQDYEEEKVEPHEPHLPTTLSDQKTGGTLGFIDWNEVTHSITDKGTPSHAFVSGTATPL